MEEVSGRRCLRHRSSPLVRLIHSYLLFPAHHRLPFALVLIPLCAAIYSSRTRDLWSPFARFALLAAHRRCIVKPVAVQPSSSAPSLA